MHLTLLVAVISAACALTACGFAPPAPPSPAKTPRVTINQSDPRLARNGGAEVSQTIMTPSSSASQTSTTTISLPAFVPTGGTPSDTRSAFPIPLAPTSVEHFVGAEQPGKSLSTPGLTPATTAEVSSAQLTGHAAMASPLVASVDPEKPAEPSEPITITEPAVIKQVWAIGPNDVTVRQALTRWAGKAGWTFGPDQWELSFDLPIEAPAEFQAESFREATQALSEAIAMTESPVRPCFYANRVLRVIPFTRSCNRAPAATPTP